MTYSGRAWTVQGPGSGQIGLHNINNYVEVFTLQPELYLYFGIPVPVPLKVCLIKPLEGSETLVNRSVVNVKLMFVKFAWIKHRGLWMLKELVAELDTEVCEC